MGTLTTRRDFTDVRDVVRAYRLLVERGAPGTVYNVCSGHDVPIAEVAARLLALAGADLELVTDPDLVRPVDVPVLRGDLSRLEAATGWKPEIPLDDTLRDVLEYWELPAAGRLTARPVRPGRDPDAAADQTPAARRSPELGLDLAHLGVGLLGQLPGGRGQLLLQRLERRTPPTGRRTPRCCRGAGRRWSPPSDVGQPLLQPEVAGQLVLQLHPLHLGPLESQDARGPTAT